MITNKNRISKSKSISKHKNKTLKKLISSNSIKILSYNISWESMSGSVKNWSLCSNNTNPDSPKHNSVCVGNIAEVFGKEVDFITLQESTDFKKLIEISPQLKKMKYEVHNSGLDVMTTFWKPKYKLVYTIKGEFENNRPWMATVFSSGICLINVHFGHYDTNEEYRKMEKMLFTIKEEIRKKEAKAKESNKNKGDNTNKDKRFIISGDFNYNIKDLGDSKNIITINGTKFYYHPKHILTCCIKRRKHNDHIIDSIARPIDISIPEVNYMASDHKPIIVELVNLF